MELESVIDRKIKAASKITFIESQEELEAIDIEICPRFTFDGEVHLAKVISCYDGDTCHCIFKYNNEYKVFIVRMYGYDSPEMKLSKDIPEAEKNVLKEKALAAKHRLEDLVINKCVYVFCKDFDKYGRVLALIKLNIDDKKTVNDIMIEEDHGYAYFGGTKRSIVEEGSQN